MTVDAKSDILAGALAHASKQCSLFKERAKANTAKGDSPPALTVAVVEKFVRAALEAYREAIFEAAVAEVLSRIKG